MRHSNDNKLMKKITVMIGELKHHHNMKHSFDNKTKTQK